MSAGRGRGAVTAVLIVTVAALEAAWLAWFLAEPLPNASNVGGRVRRWIFLARALPGVIPGVRFDQSYLGLALRELGHLENLPQRVPIAVAAAWVAGAACSLGRLLLRGLGLFPSLDPAERVAIGFGLGATGLGVATLLLGRLGGLAPWPVRVLLAIPIVADSALALRGRGTDAPPPRRPRSPLPWIGLAAVVAPFLAIMALGALLPTIDFDATEYHLQGPKEYFQAGRIAFLPHNVYTSMPFGVEMLHLLGMEVMADWWRGALAGQGLVALFAAAAATLVGLVAYRLGSGRAAWVAAAVYVSTPWIYRLGVIPYVEGPLCYYHAALVWGVVRAWHADDDRIRARLWALIGLLAGGAMACKYPALISAVVPFGSLAIAAAVRRRSWSIVFGFAAGWGVVMTPWLGRNVIDTGNPVYPLAHRVFGGRQWDEAREAKWNRVHGPGVVTWKALQDAVVEVAGRSDWQSPLYTALAPLALLRRGSRRASGWLWGFVLYLFATWWLLTHRIDRFWLPLLPPLAILAGLGADWVRSRAWSWTLAVLLGLAILGNLAYDTTALAGFNEWTSDLEALRTGVPEMLNPPLARLDAELPEDSRVLLVGQAAVFHFRHPIVYNTVFNLETLETLARGRSAAEVGRALRERGITHVYVDWFEIERYRKPGNYGFTPFVTPEVFSGLVASGVLTPPEALGSRQDVYRVR